MTEFPLPLPDYPFDQKNEMFKRRAWDEEYIPLAKRLYSDIQYQDRPGYRKLDYALRNAAWNLEYDFALGTVRSDSGMYSWSRIADKARRFVETGGRVSGSPEENSRILKKAARFYGAALVGISPVHPHVVYSHEYNPVEKSHYPLELPAGCDRAVVVAVEMDYETSRHSPNAVAGASTGLGYSMQAVTANLLAAFIRHLGYTAVPSGNDTALSIPLAIAAGLGEMGRMGLLITEKYGPRVRLAKVFTDMPLAVDSVRRFGVEQFCRTCRKCARFCPSGAITDGDQTDQGPSLSNHSGIRKWYIDPEKCFRFWVKNWIDCNNCVMCCPFNKPPGSLHDLTRAVIRRTTAFNRFFLWLDDLFGYGKPLRNKDFWNEA